MRALLFALLISFPFTLFAADDELPIKLEHAHINIHNKASIQRGAKFFAETCLVCHTLKYVQHDNIAKEAGITLDKMPLKNKQWWLNIVPPDLSLIATEKGADYLYTYFHSFYKDPKRPTGFNNLIQKDVNMTNIFYPYQGEQVLTEKKQLKVSPLRKMHKPSYYTVLTLIHAGSMTPAEFDRTTTDLVNFLVYVSEPNRAYRESLGWWVLGFLAVLALLAYFLYKEYWKDVH